MQMSELQAKSNNNLALCPFCGGEAEMLTAESMNGGYLFGIMCNDCRSRGDVYDTEAEAIAAWNSRADYHGYEQATIEAWESIKAWNSRAERTCQVNELDALTQTLSMANGCSWGECSECGCLTPTDSAFCVECGAKVVSE